MKEKILQEKIKYFYNLKEEVHIKRNDDMFFNGLILECTDGMIILEDLKYGSMPIMLAEIVKIDPRIKNE